MFVVLDLETTGLSPKNDSIIEIACVKIDPISWEEIDRLHSYVNTSQEIPKLISQITGIFSEDIEGAPNFWDLRDDVEDFLRDMVLIGHNIPFDISFLESHGIELHANPRIDTFFLANFLVRWQGSLNLWYLCNYFSIPLIDAHRAIDDTLATAKLFMRLVEELKNTEETQKQIISYFLHTSQDIWIQIFCKQYLADVKQTLSKDDILSMYQEIYSKNFPCHLDKKQTKSVLKIDDYVKSVENFSLREGQKTMLDIVDKTIKVWGNLAVEAPTGIGKTYAYLIPSIVYSINSWETVHISTHTKVLQDQIFFKDLKYLQEQGIHNFSYAKLKWKRNYFSINAFHDFLDLQEDKHISFILKCILWSLETSFWELDELEFYGEEFLYLSEIHAGNIRLQDTELPYRNLEFVILARDNAKNANIVVTNNSILIQDSISEGSLLWWVKNLIVDEAHNLEDVVTQSLKKMVNYDFIHRHLERVEELCIKQKEIHDSFWSIKQRLLFDLADFFWYFEGKIFEKFSLNTKYKTMLLQEEMLDDNALLLIKNIRKHISSLQEIYLSLSEKMQKKLHFAWEELQWFKDFFYTLWENRDYDNFIFYIQHSEKRGLEIVTTVLRPWKFLEESFWSQCESVVLTSATLQMQESFSYIIDMLSLDSFETLALEQIFDYQRQALLYIPNNLWSIKNNFQLVLGFLRRLFLCVRWNTLVLYTSFANISETYSELKRDMLEHDIHLFAQSIGGSKHKQIEEFKKNSSHGVLLGTDTFWEWVDIPGTDLQYLIIHKIPFPVPSDPIFQARSQLYKNAFQEYAIPKAIIKLRQGFWRLIRRPEDTGIVVFLDDRIHTSSWWKAFFDAFPRDIKIRLGSTEQLLWVLQGDES